MTVDWTITAGNIIEGAATITGFIVAGLGFFYALRADLTILSTRVLDVEQELKELSKVLVQMAAQSTRLEDMDRRTDRIQMLLDTLIRDIRWSSGPRDRPVS